MNSLIILFLIFKNVSQIGVIFIRYNKKEAEYRQQIRGHMGCIHNWQEFIWVTFAVDMSVSKLIMIQQNSKAGFDNFDIYNM
jgi:hypothetical protein